MDFRDKYFEEGLHKLDETLAYKCRGELVERLEICEDVARGAIHSLGWVEWNAYGVHPYDPDLDLICTEISYKSRTWQDVARRFF